MMAGKRGVFILEAGTGSWLRKTSQRRWVFVASAARQSKAKGLTESI